MIDLVVTVPAQKRHGDEAMHSYTVDDHQTAVKQLWQAMLAHVRVSTMKLAKRLILPAKAPECKNGTSRLSCMLWERCLRHAVVLHDKWMVACHQQTGTCNPSLFDTVLVQMLGSECAWEADSRQVWPEAWC